MLRTDTLLTDELKVGPRARAGTEDWRTGGSSLPSVGRGKKILHRKFIQTRCCEKRYLTGSEKGGSALLSS